MKKFDGVAIIEGIYSNKILRLWEKNGMKRIYINSDDNKKSYGYIDLNNGNEIVCSADIKHDMQKIVKEFLENYEI